MRAIFEQQLELGSTPIEKIQLDPKSRDDMPAVLRGLQHIYMDRSARKQLFAILAKRVNPKVSRRRGRPGMSLWQIFVLAVVKSGLNCDFDRLTDYVNNHGKLRQMMGHGFFNDKHYSMQAVMDNVKLLSEAALEEINAVVVACGHRLVKHRASDPLHCRTDSAVVRTHVHWPTDVRLLKDAMDALIRDMARLCRKLAIAGWRKARFWLRQLKRAFHRVRTARQCKNKDKVTRYLSLCLEVIRKAEASLVLLKRKGVENEKVAWYLEAGKRLTDQIVRRLLKNEVIPHREKIFSIHEPHTRWINKGKAGVPAELGVPVCVLEDQHQFILRYHALHQGGDQDMIVPFLTEAKRHYPGLTSCSMDKGYYTPANRAALDQLLPLNVMPKKGRLREADRARETDPAFVKARQQHPAVESAINNLNHRGLDLVRTHGKEGFDRTVGQAVVAANVHRIGKILKQQDEDRHRWHEARNKGS